MATFRFSAFADEYSPVVDEQIRGLLENDVRLIEPRNVDGVNISDLPEDKAKEFARKLNAAGIGISALGSPIGKIKIDDDFEAHKEKLRRTCVTAQILGATRIRMFSFYMPKDCEDYSPYRDEVFARMSAMLDIADEYGVKLCHENEKGIYGDTPERCLELAKAFPNRLGCVFDPANYLQVGAEPFPHGFEMLEPYIDYMHVKDCNPGGTVAGAGTGIGCIPEMFAVLNLHRSGEIICTVEPHLKAFKGLADLEANAKTVIKNNGFATAADAFAAAIRGAKMCLPRTATVQ